MKADKHGEWVLWEDVAVELDLKDSEIAKLEARIEELEMDREDLACYIRTLEERLDLLGGDD